MLFCENLSTEQILAVFTEEITARGGTVTDTFHDGNRLFLRSVLPRMEEVRPGDQLQAGVALKATEHTVWLHPYTFRLVCSNGAIVAHALRTCHLTDLHLRNPDEAVDAIREVIAVCASAEAFTTAAGKMRSACAIEADLALNLLPLLARTSLQHNREFLSRILDHFFQEEDRSQFSLIQAVTAVARDTRDPEARWDLEELGGALAAGKTPWPLSGGRATAEARRGDAVLVG